MINWIIFFRRIFCETFIFHLIFQVYLQQPRSYYIFLLIHGSRFIECCPWLLAFHHFYHNINILWGFVIFYLFCGIVFLYSPTFMFWFASSFFGFYYNSNFQSIDYMCLSVCWNFNFLLVLRIYYRTLCFSEW